MMMPVLCPSGEHVALVGHDHVPKQARVLVLDLKSHDLQPVPQTSQAETQLWPVWIDDQHLAYLRVGQGTVEVMTWSRHDDRAIGIGKVDGLEVERFDPALLQAGLAHPLSPDRSRLACYDVVRDRIVIFNLESSTRADLSPGTRAGCWVDDSVFASATDKHIEMTWVDRGQTVELMTGSWLPRWSDGQGKSMILLGRVSDPNMFELTRAKRRGWW